MWTILKLLVLAVRDIINKKMLFNFEYWFYIKPKVNYQYLRRQNFTVNAGEKSHINFSKKYIFK